MSSLCVYILHYDKPLKHARHYVGATRDLEARMEKHRQGHSTARITAAFHDQGSTFVVARTWITEQAFQLERWIKKHYHHVPRLCPICNPGNTCGEFREFMEGGTQ